MEQDFLEPNSLSKLEQGANSCWDQNSLINTLRATMEFRCRSLMDLPRDVLILVLIRLPHRELLKCMFVSKSLCAIICQPKFIDSYCMHNPICLILSTSNTDIFGRSLYCCNLNPSGCQVGFLNLKNLSPSYINEFFNLKNVFFTRRLNVFQRCGVTDIVDGFLCYYRSCAVLVNVFSGELTNITVPHALAKIFYFGFDPVNRVYKLLCCTNQILGRAYYAHPMFHILTIADTSAKEFSWRKLVPPFSDDPEDYFYPASFQSHSVSINGSLYWIESDNQNFARCRIISFHLTREKFRSFMSPNADEDFFVNARLVQFRGRIALLSCVGIDVIVLYTLEINGDGDAYEWTQHTLILPVVIRGVVTPIGNLLNGNLLFADLSQGGGGGGSVSKVGFGQSSVYAYDHETDKFERIGAASFPEWKIWEFETNSSLRISTVEQTTNAMKALIRQFGPRF